MNRTRLMIIGIASVAAIGAAMVARNFMAAPPPQTKVVQEKVERTDVLVVARNVNMGEVIPAGALEWRAWPRKMVSAGMITRKADPEAISRFVGRRARAPLFRGEPMIAEKVIPKGGFLSALLPKGMRAVAVKISTETASGGFIQPNDRVDVILTRKVNDQMISEVVLYNVRVLAIDQKALPGKEGNAKNGGSVAQKSVRTATVEVTEEQAKVLAKVQSIGELSLALRSLAEAEGDLADDGPRLSPKFARNAGGEVNTLRYGIPGTQVLNN